MKKSTRTVLKLVFWSAILACGLWIAFAPKHHYVPPTARVPVEESLFEPPSTIVPPPTIGEETLPQGTPPQAAIPHVLPKIVQKHKPVIAIIIDDVGLDLHGSKRAINLPGYVTLAFLPYAPRLKEQTRDARDHGHKLMLHMPMEPVGHDNPGPNALLVNLPMEELRQRFETALASFGGFEGMNNHMGSKFTAYAEGMEMVMDELKQRNLFFVDSRTSIKSVAENIARKEGIPAISRDVFLDDTIKVPEIMAQLAQTERIARRKGYAVAIGHPHDATMDALEKWLPEAEARGVTFVPVRELVTPPLTD